jgi:hypothetical protein
MFVQLVRSIGFAWKGGASVMAYVMPLALVGLGATRLIAGWPRK